MIQPKPFLDKLHLRSKKEGNAQRIDMSLKILDKGTPLPLPVEYKDIDSAMQEWVDKELNIVYDGEKLPTFKLFANQRINEYSQTWQHLDNNGNLLLNFKTITRENNPQKGDNQGQSANIPGDRYYPMFLVPTLEDNQQIAYDMYSMKQPFCVNMEYTITLITNKYELLNQMNQMVNDKFKSINVYIFPNNHPMPLTLDSINDESEYSLDDRKYYSQSYKLKLKAYIIQEKDFQITKVPSRLAIKTMGDKSKRTNKNISYDRTGLWNDSCYTQEESRYTYQKIILTIDFGYCNEQKTILENDFTLRNIETFNVYDFVLFINGEKQNLENELMFEKDDELVIKISKNNSSKTSQIIIHGFDPTIVYDSYYDPESSLDEQKDNYLNK